MSNKSIFYGSKSSSTVKESLVLTFRCRAGYIAYRKISLMHVTLKAGAILDELEQG